MLSAFFGRGKLCIFHTVFLLFDLGGQLLHLLFHLTGFLRITGSFIVLFQVVQFRNIRFRGLAKEFLVDIESAEFVSDGILMEVVEMTGFCHVDEHHGHVEIAFVKRFVDVEGFSDQGECGLVVFFRVQIEGLVVQIEGVERVVVAFVFGVQVHGLVDTADGLVELLVSEVGLCQQGGSLDIE